MKWNEDSLAKKVWTDKYALRDEENRLVEQKPEEMWRRLNGELKRIGGKYKDGRDYYKYLEDFRYIILGGSLMYAIGNPYKYISGANCFVIESPEDSYSSILKTDAQIVHVSKRRGGCGFDISKLRPSNYPTSNAAGTSSGPISFVKRYSNTINEVCQNGRRGAGLICMHVNHPSIRDFIEAKSDNTSITGCNLSVKLTDNFMNKVLQDVEHELRFPVESDNIVEVVRASELFKRLCYYAWKHAEPGCLFWDTHCRNSLSNYYEDYRLTSTNPCGEQPLPPLCQCRLLSINLYSLVDSPFTKKASVDWKKLEEVVRAAVRIGDNCVDLELEKIESIISKIEDDPEDESTKREELELWEQVYEKCRDARHIGVGVTGLADMLAALNIEYGNKCSLNFVDELFTTIRLAAFDEQTILAEERCPFPVFNFDIEKDIPFIKELEDLECKHTGLSGKRIYESVLRYGRRNMGVLTVAPAGSLSILASTSSGIEPLFALSMSRRKRANEGEKADWVDENGVGWIEYEILHEPYEQYGVNSWVCADEVDPIGRVRMQAIIQQHIDASISSTINLPKSATADDIAAIYMEAWKSGCKGVTVYRDGSREGILVVKRELRGIPQHDAPKRPPSLRCDIHTPTIKGEQYVVLVGMLEDFPYEIFAFKGNVKKGCGIITKHKRGYYELQVGETTYSPIMEEMSEADRAICRLTSMSLRHGVNIKFVVQQLEKVGEVTEIHGFARVMARVLKKYVWDGEKENGASCVECGGNNLVRVNGCVQCNDCGWSKCS